MEEWHQKLHNNTSPDDVVICQVMKLLISLSFLMACLIILTFYILVNLSRH